MAYPCLAGKTDPQTGVFAGCVGNWSACRLQSNLHFGSVRSERFVGCLALLLSGPSFQRRFRGLERSGSIAFPDRVHRYIPLVASGPRHYFALRDDTETELSRGTGSFAISLVSQGGWNVC